MRGRRASLLLSALLGTWPLMAGAVGGDDVNTGTKVMAATQACQAEIAKKGAAFASATAKAVNDCLDAIVKCDEQSNAGKALACRRGLLRPGTGKCAVGKLDEGASLTGTGAAAHADSLAATSKAALIKAMNTYNASLQKKCFDAAGVDLASVSIGLGFSPAPANKLQLSDATNANPGGVGCLANGLVLQTHPLADDIVSVLDPLHETCVASNDELELGTACTTNGDCGAGGLCGKLAKVVRDGSIEECLRVLPASGQTQCWNTSGTLIACAGTGQDGDLQAGATLSYTDNGDGTITDHNTGLMWEKRSDDGGIHDYDDTYTWENAVAVKIATLNGGGGFAGHTDWRLPNKKELESIINAEVSNPSVSSVFHTGCVSGATVLTGSCTLSSYHWSSSTYVSVPQGAWLVYFSDGYVAGGSKTNHNSVRAVRGSP